MATKAARLRTVQVLETDQEEESPTKGIPLFQSGDGEQQIATISVYRLEPIEEGTVGNVQPDADEDTLRRRWGGGVFRLFAKGTDGKHKGSKTVTIGGDPKFEGKDAIRRYKIKTGEIVEDPPKPAAAAPAPPPPGLGLPELLALITQGHAQQMEMMRLQTEATKHEAAEREAKARREADERETRARREAEEREARLRREAEEMRERDRAFQATMLQMVKSDAKASDPTAMLGVLLKGLELGRDMGGGGGDGPADPVTALFSNLPALRDMFATAAQQGAAGQVAAPTPAKLPPGPPGKRIVLAGAVAEKLEAAVGALRARGYDPEKALEMAFDQIRAEAAPTAPPEPPAAAPPAPAGNGTPRATRATRKR